MNFQIKKSREEQRKDLLDEIHKKRNELEELELTKQERWHDVKDFVGGNSWEKMKSFEKWNRDLYKPSLNKLNRELKKLTEKFDQL